MIYNHKTLANYCNSNGHLYIRFIHLADTIVNKCDSVCFCRYIGALGARVICDNIPGLVNKQRQLCQRHPDLMQSIGEGAKEWIRECQHQFRHHRWNCSTLERDHTVFGRVMLRSKCLCYTLFLTMADIKIIQHATLYHVKNHIL